MLKTKYKMLTIVALAFLMLVGCYYLYKFKAASIDRLSIDRVQAPFTKVESVEAVKSSYDLIVVGTDPEGIMAAVSGARNGLSVLLLEGRDRDILGGLMTLGGLNTLDLNYSPNQPWYYRYLHKSKFLNEGLFQEWFDQVEGSSVDTHTAANVFYKMIKQEQNIDLLMHVQKMEPILQQSGENMQLTGLSITKPDGRAEKVAAKVVIDASQDADIAAASGVPYSIGRQDIGEGKAKMAATLVFRMDNVTNEAWRNFKGLEGLGLDSTSIWGFGDARKYPPSDPEKVKIRSLNIGRENNETMLFNTMQIYGVDPLDPESVARGMEVGKKESPLIVDYLKKTYPQFANMNYAGTASELYIRESRHIYGEYRLTLADVLENRDKWDAIAYGSYDVDIQSINYSDVGTIMLSPMQYGVPFRSLVPLKVDGLLVVGRSASFDTIPHGSARVIPLGMATAEAAGAAASLAISNDITVRELSQSTELISKLRKKLVKQGMDLTYEKFDQPAYMKHKDYKGLVAAASMYMTSGSYSNEAWDLDGSMSIGRYLNKLRTLKKAHPDQFPGFPDGAVKDMKDLLTGPLTLEQSAYMLALTAGLDTTREAALKDLISRGWISEEIIGQMLNVEELTNGDTYMMFYDILKNGFGIVYE